MTAERPWAVPAIFAAAGALLVAGAGTTVTELGPWYKSLRQPDWLPPDWAFGLIWTIIFILAAAAAVNGWRRAPDPAAAKMLIGLFVLNGFLNLLWSFLFFKMQRPDWAMTELVMLWLSILGLIVVTMRYAKVAALLLIPYLVWVSIAGRLNYEVIMLNGPFG